MIDLLHPDSLAGVTTEEIELQETLERTTLEEASTNYKEKYTEAKTSGKDMTQFKPEAWLLDKTIEPMAQGLALYLQESYSKGGSGTKLQKRARKFFKTECNLYNLSFITARVCLNQTDEKESLQRICVQIGNAIMQDTQYRIFREKCPGYVHTIEENLKSKNNSYRQTVLTYNRHKMGIADLKWNERYRFTVGSLLLEVFIASCSLFEIHKFKKGGRKWMRGIRQTVETKKKLNDAHGFCALLHPLHQMMLIKPMKWSDACNGGFYTNHYVHNVCVIKRREEEVVREMVNNSEMSPVYDALNKLQDTPYRINKRVFDVFKEFVGTGKAGLPAQDVNLLLPMRPWGNDDDSPTPEFKAYKRQKANVYDAYYNASAKRAVTLAQLRIARKFKDEPAIYFCWNMDWRGRVYPLQAHLHPQSNDAGKGLLEFANGTKLGTTGAKWLSIYGANCFGEDKVSHLDRQRWVVKHTDQIKKCAKNPKDFTWWMEADKPFLFLAFCFEWAGYLESDRSGNYECHLPVQMDGACNGLQHFSAMLRDPVGAKAVSLTPDKLPGDIYAEVAKVVSRMVAADAKVTPIDDGTRALRTMGQLWKDKVTRAWTKRNCMTFVYGASLHGFTEQLINELRKYKDKKHEHYLAEGTDDMLAAAYLAKKNRAGIGEVVTKPADAMEWLKAFARYISDLNQGVRWCCPTGMPIKQEYNKMKCVRFKTYWGEQKVRIDLKLSKPTDQTDNNRMANGIAPNFVHSMDATHLMQTVNAMTAEGITDLCFIHDSFGCPAGQVEEMQRILRETFVELYKGDVLNDWYIAVLQQLTSEEVEGWEGGGPPELGAFDVSQVIDSPYFFS